MAKLSKWTKIWIAWLAALGVLDLIAAIQRKRGRRKPATFTEHIRQWFRGRWRRALLVGLLALLSWHLLSAPDVQSMEWQP